MSLTRADIRGVVGIVPTPATSDAADWRAENTVNTSETETMIEQVIDAGIEFVMSTGTFGECASLTHDEWLTFTTSVARAVRGRVPFFSGVTTLNTRDTISRCRQAVAAGADGLFVGRPMWLPLDDDGVVRYYRDITEALPGVPIVVYDNPAAFKGKISVEAYLKLADLPEIGSCPLHQSFVNKTASGLIKRKTKNIHIFATKKVSQKVQRIFNSRDEKE